MAFRPILAAAWLTALCAASNMRNMLIGERGLAGDVKSDHRDRNA